MIQVEGCEYQNGKLPMGLTHVFVVLHTVSDTFLLFYLTYQVGDIDLVFFVERLKIREHGQL